MAPTLCRGQPVQDRPMVEIGGEQEVMGSELKCHVFGHLGWTVEAWWGWGLTLEHMGLCIAIGYAHYSANLIWRHDNEKQRLYSCMVLRCLFLANCYQWWRQIVEGLGFPLLFMDFWIYQSPLLTYYRQTWCWLFIAITPWPLVRFWCVIARFEASNLRIIQPL